MKEKPQSFPAFSFIGPLETQPIAGKLAKGAIGFLRPSLGTGPTTATYGRPNVSHR